MKSEELRKLIAGRRRWTEPLSPEARERGFKGWYASKRLPHFDSPGAQQFVSYRLAGALPTARQSEWKTLLAIEDDLERQRFIEGYLDKGYGECHLSDQRVADPVQSNFWHEDGASYRLFAWVIMPNDVHVLIEIWQVPLGEIVKSWKGYTAKKANPLLGRHGQFWEEDYFDRYIRDEEHFRRVVHYIESNPVKAGLVPAAADWPWSSARFRSKEDLSGRTLTHPNAQRIPLPPEPR